MAEHTDQSFGRWAITDAIGTTLPRKAQVEIALVGDGLRFKGVAGAFEAVLPAAMCRYEPYGKRTGYLSFGGEAAWLKSDTEPQAADLEAALRLRHVPTLVLPLAPEPDPTGPVHAKAYRVDRPEAAAAALAADAERYGALGYALVSQTWAEPDRSPQTALAVGSMLVFLFGLLFLGAPFIALFIWVVALLLFAMSNAARQDGSLLATFERKDGATGRPAAGEPAGGETMVAAVSVRDRLLELTRLRDEGLVTEEEWTAKRAELITGL